MDNKGFTLTFGKMPSNYIERCDLAEKTRMCFLSIILYRIRL